MYFDVFYEALKKKNVVEAFKALVGADKSGELDKDERWKSLSQEDLASVDEMYFTSSTPSKEFLASYLSDTSSGRPFYVSRPLAQKLTSCVDNKDLRCFTESFSLIPKASEDIITAYKAFIYKLITAVIPKAETLINILNDLHKASETGNIDLFIEALRKAVSENLLGEVERYLGFSIADQIAKLFSKSIEELSPEDLEKILSQLPSEASRLLKGYVYTRKIIDLMGRKAWKDLAKLINTINADEELKKSVEEILESTGAVASSDGKKITSLKDLYVAVLSAFFMETAKSLGKDPEKMSIEDFLAVLRKASEGLGVDVKTFAEEVFGLKPEDLDKFVRYEKMLPLIQMFASGDFEKIYSYLVDYVNKNGLDVLTKDLQALKDLGVIKDDPETFLMKIEYFYLYDKAKELYEKASKIESADLEKIFTDFVNSYVGKSPLPLSQTLLKISQAVKSKNFSTAVSIVNNIKDPDMKSFLAGFTASLAVSVASYQDASAVADLLSSLGFSDQAKRWRDIASVSDILTAVEKKDFDTAFRLITTADREKIEALKRVLGSDEELKNYLSMIELGYLSSKLSEAKSWKDVVGILSQYLSSISPELRESLSKSVEDILSRLPLATVLMDIDSLAESSVKSGSISYDSLKSLLNKLPQDLRASALAYFLSKASTAVKPDDAKTLEELFTSVGAGDRTYFLEMILSLDVSAFKEYFINRVMSELKDAWEKSFSSGDESAIKSFVDRYGEILSQIPFSMKIAGRDVSLTLADAPSLFTFYKTNYPSIKRFKEDMTVIMNDLESFRNAVQSGKNIDDVSFSKVYYDDLERVLKALRENNDLQKVIALMVFADVGDGKLLATIAENTDSYDELIRYHQGLVLMKNKDSTSTKIFLDLASKAKDPEKRTAYTDLAYASILRTAGAQTADVECVLGKAETGAGGGATGPGEAREVKGGERVP